MSKKVLLTGATGFLGGYVIKEISEHPDYEVVAVGRNEKRGRELESELVRSLLAVLLSNDCSKTKSRIMLSTQAH